MSRILIFLSIMVIAAGCGQQVDLAAAAAGIPFNDPNVQDPSGSCADAAIKTQYIVKWKSGEITKERGDSDEEFIRYFVLPNKDQIEISEPDFRISIPENAQALATVQTVALADNWGQININAGAAWSQGAYGKGVIVAVVDTGIDRTHPQLQSRLQLNPGEMGTDAQGRNKETNGVDDDNNGFVDDWNGWNFITHTGAADDDNGHGTHVSGIIAAYHTDTAPQAASYVEGLAPQATILPLKFLDNTGSGQLSDAVVAITYAANHGAKVINASWGGTACSATLQSTIASLSNQNILFVAASGNDSVDLADNPRYPASYSSLAQLTIGAIGIMGSMADYSNYGVQAVQLFAPGTNVISTYLNSGLASLSGTSMATPFVTGTAALLYGLHPTANLTQIRTTITASVTKNSTYLNATQGRLDLTNLLSNFH